MYWRTLFASNDVRFYSLDKLTKGILFHRQRSTESPKQRERYDFPRDVSAFLYVFDRKVLYPSLQYVFHKSQAEKSFKEMS